MALLVLVVLAGALSALVAADAAPEPQSAGEPAVAQARWPRRVVARMLAVSLSHIRERDRNLIRGPRDTDAMDRYLVERARMVRGYNELAASAPPALLVAHRLPARME